jgi:hypothetical protein
LGAILTLDVSLHQCAARAVSVRAFYLTGRRIEAFSHGLGRSATLD